MRGTWGGEPMVSRWDEETKDRGWKRLDEAGGVLTCRTQEPCQSKSCPMDNAEPLKSVKLRAGLVRLIS